MSKTVLKCRFLVLKSKATPNQNKLYGVILELVIRQIQNIYVQISNTEF